MSEPSIGGSPSIEPADPASSSGQPRPGAPVPPSLTKKSATPDEPGAPAYGRPPLPVAPPSYGQPGYGATPYGTPPSAPGSPPSPGMPGQPAPMSPTDEHNWAIAAHLSGFVAAYVALGFIGPLVVLLVAGNRSAYVRRHALEALNFNLSVLLYVLICVPLVFILIGIPMIVAIGLLYLVATIRGAVAASRAEEYRYPLTIRFVR